MLAHAIDNPAPSTIILLSGDHDFAYAVSILRLRRYRVVIASLRGVHTSLTSQASTYLDWTTDVVGAEPLDSCPSSTRHSTKEIFCQLNTRWLYPEKTKLRAKLSTDGLDSEVTEIDIMDYFPDNKADQFRRMCDSRTSRDGSSEGSHFGGNDPPSVEDEHSVGTLRPPSRTESAPPSCYSGEVASTLRAVAQDKTTPDITSTMHVKQGLMPKATESLILAAEPREPEQELSARSSPSPTVSRFGSISIRSQVNERPSECQGQRDPVTPRVFVPQEGSLLPNETEKIRDVVSMFPTVSILSEGTGSSMVGQLVPPLFVPLVERLEHHRLKGFLRPLRSSVGFELATQYQNVYRRAGVERFGAYVALAEKAGIVELGGTDGGAWIGLRPEWYDVDCKST